MKITRYLVSCCLFAGAMQAGWSHEYSHLLREKQYEQVEREVKLRLDGDPNQADALVARVELILAQNQVERLGEAIRHAEQCVAAHAQTSMCYEALGNALGAQAIAGGFGTSLANASRIREAYVTAVDLEAKNYRARVSLARYYLTAPFLLGGSSSKALELARDTSKLNANVGKLILALCSAKEGDNARAEQLALGTDLSDAEDLNPVLRDLLYRLGTSRLELKKYAESSQIFAELSKKVPNSEYGYYGLALVADAQNQHAEAMAYLDHASKIATRAYIYELAGNVALKMNDKQQAISAFQSALKVTPGLAPKERQVLEKRLFALKAVK